MVVLSQKAIFKNFFAPKACKSKSFLFLLVLIFVFNLKSSLAQEKNKIDLSGKWEFQIDSLNIGIAQKWYNKQLDGKINLPGSMTTNGIGNDIDLKTPWTGDILDSSYYKKPEYAKYRAAGNIKIPFWLQPIKYYKGVAWYQKVVDIPKSFGNKSINIFLERPHWQTTLWVDDKSLGSQNSLGTAHQFLIGKGLTEGKHIITIRIDNGIDTLKVGEDSHSITDNTQGNWNGIIGKMELQAIPKCNIQNVQVYPDIQNKKITVKLYFDSFEGKTQKGVLEIFAQNSNPSAEKLPLLTKDIKIGRLNNSMEVVYPMGQNPLLWDEFNPNVYSLKVNLKTKLGNSQKTVDFGMREFAAQGKQFLMNGKPVFLRGTLDCAAYPITGYPPTDINSWITIFSKLKSYGLNHVRYHSWTPPEAAFEAADKLGFYLQVECSSWANGDARVGEGWPLDQWLYEESNRMEKAYGNHPSFVMMAYGNEPKGKDHVKYLTDFVKYWEAKDNRRLYTTGAGWPVIAESDYDNTPNPRIQRWGEGLKSIINAEPPKANYNWANRIEKAKHPTVSHEIGQWCVYPDFKEIKEYTGILKPKNFEIFEDKLKENKLYSLADSFLLASGKLQVLCYKADIEAALRTPHFGGFQLLGLSDFPGQGTALVGVLNAFWQDKNYITGKEFSHFCSPTVPLALFPKFIYHNNETLDIPIKLAHYGNKLLKEVTPTWNIKDVNGKILFYGQLNKKDLPLGNDIDLGNISQSLSAIDKAEKLQLNINVADGHNSWDFFVYPAILPKLETKVFTTQKFDKEALDVLNKGGRVLLTLKKGEIKPEMGGNVKIGFSSIFWNTSYTSGQAPNTLGILCNPNHPALNNFPTDYYSNWQWWDGMMHSNAIRLDSVSKDIKPIVRVIDDWYTASSLGLIFECKVGNGKLLVSGIDLLEDNDKRPEAKQLLYSLQKYMGSDRFSPKTEVNVNQINKLFN
ncbi:beta-galactosidase [Pedobacter sp. SD-b]|uniref:beta-galactosidase n=1 Tax=Pedobacter segetis TaxID=2793069 RepID=A0ABS1BMJ5_9SPHI|nr:sugar-binding domain-containing protein [Pedobacter segetis]MBK0384076.1 beta-galactosidase [Pedobacter segetis]